MKTASLQNEIEYQENKPAIRLILETDFTKEIRILFKKDQVMKEHKAPFPIVVHIVKGSIDFGVNGKTLLLKEGDLITLDANVPHDLTAKEESMVRLTLSKGDKSERVQQAAQG